MLSEAPETFSDYRFDVTFTHAETGTTMRVPGYFAADGASADTGATSGSVWRVHFNPSEAGEWTYVAEFRAGDDVAASVAPGAGVSAGFMDGATGTLTAAAAEDTGVDLRGKGPLQHSEGAYARFSAVDEAFIKAGTNSPENFLAYDGFDNTTPTHAYEPHAGDWNVGDPTWGADERGKEIIGALNYLGEEGVNALYFITMTAAGDGRDVWPWVDDGFADIPRFTEGLTPEQAEAARTYDVSKLAQWDVVFEHAQSLGITLHLVLQEQENDQLLNGGDLGVERNIYLREMVARFGHHNGLMWNLGEELTKTPEQIKSFATLIKTLDPNDHLVVAHTHPGDYEEVYAPLLGFEDVDGVSLQVDEPKPLVEEWSARSAEAGNPWVIHWDETGPLQYGVPPDDVPSAATAHPEIRGDMWETYFAGGAGVEWYFGYRYPNNDLNLEDFRSRDSVWEWTVAARRFVEDVLPFDEMAPADALAPAGASAFAQAGEVYAVYLPSLGAVGDAPATLDLTGVSGAFTVEWYDPRVGGDLLAGSVSTVSGGGVVALGTPDGLAAGQDWTVLVRRAEAPEPSPFDGLAAPAVYDADALGGAVLRVTPGIEDVQHSTYAAHSFAVENVGDKQIAAIHIDVDGALYADSVFDPFGVAGDTLAKPLRINNPGGTAPLDPESYDPYIGLGGTAGYHGLLLRYDLTAAGGFEPGEAMTFSVDMDPNTISGMDAAALVEASGLGWDVGGVSGAELSGARFTVLFDDGSTATGRVLADGSQAGGQALAEQTAPAAATTPGLIVVEAETAAPTGAWVLEDDQPGAASGAHLRWDGPRKAPSDAPLRYEIEVAEAGVYSFAARGGREDGAAEGDSNDFWVRVAELDGPWRRGFLSPPTDDEGWAWATQGVVGQTAQDLTFALEAGTYVVEIDGRSTGFHFDGFTMALDAPTLDMTPPPPPPPPSEPLSLTVDGLMAGASGLRGEAAPVVVIDGPAGAVARIVLSRGFQTPVDGELGATVTERLEGSDFPVTNAADFQTVDVTLTGAPMDVSALFDTASAPNGYPIDPDSLSLGFMAALIDPARDGLAISPVTDAIRLNPDVDPVVAAINAGGAATMVDGVAYAADDAALLVEGSQDRTWDFAAGGFASAVLPAPHDTERYGDFAYAIAVGAGGVYDVTLSFAESYVGVDAPGERVFDVAVEGALWLDDFDILAEAPRDTVVERTVRVALDDDDATIDLAFISESQNAKVNAIVVREVEAPPPVITQPTVVAAVNSGGVAVEDSGVFFEADLPRAPFALDPASPQNRSWTYAETPAALADDPLAGTERFGDFGYDVDVTAGGGDAGGVYAVTLIFHEVSTTVTGPGERVFDVALEGALVLDSFDILAQPDGDGRVERRFLVDMAEGDAILDIDVVSEVENGKLSGFIVESAPDVPNGALLDIEALF